MIRLFTYLKLRSDKPTSDKLTFVKRSNLYSFFINIGILSFIGFGTFGDFGFFISKYIFLNTISETESEPDIEDSSNTLLNFSYIPGSEICGNLIDDDGDGFIDSDDPDCIAAGSCGCPPGGVVYDTISSGHLIPVGAIHCITEDVTLDDSWSNIDLRGSLYLVDTAHLFIDGGIDITAGSNLIVCESASYVHQQTVNVYYSIYNFGWLQISGTGTDVDTLIMGENSLTALAGGGLDINGSLDYVGSASNNAYLFLDISTSLNGGTGSVCLPGGSSEIIVEVDAASTTPTCVTDCNGCAEMASITETHNDGSVETAYNAIIAALPSKNPGGVAGSAVWLKADYGTSSSSEGTAINFWNDDSGNTINVSQATGSKQPVFRNNTTDNINFNPVIDLDGVDDELNYASGILGSTVYTNSSIFAVSRTDEVKDHTLLHETTLGGAHFLFHNPWVDNNIHWDGNNSNRISAPWTYNLGDPYLWTGHNNSALGTKSELRLNGATLNSSFSSLSSFQGDNNPLNIGSEGGLKYYNGKIGELMVFLNGLTDDERNQVESYLAIKYGFTLDQTPSQDYTASDGSTTYWDAITNLLYNDNIAGIARDDNSGLLQKQSKSVNDGLQVVIGNGNTIAVDNASNSSTFAANNSALIWGDNNGAVDSWTSIGAPSGREKLNRTWKVQVTGSAGSVKIQIADNSAINGNGLPKENTSVYLLVNTSNFFFSGATEHLMTLNGDNWEVDGVFTDGLYFTFATVITPKEICGNLSDDNSDGRTDETYPGGIESNLQLWLNAETGTNTTDEGQNINVWADQSSNGFSANADVNATDYPTFTNNAINFHPGINFDGDYTDDYSDGLHLGADYIYATDNGLHVIMVVDPNIDSETDNHCFDFGLAANGGYGMIYSNNDYGMYTNNSNGGTNTELIHSEGDDPALIEFEVDFNDYQSFFRNGTNLDSIPITIDYLDDSRVNEADTFGIARSSGPVTIGRKSASIYLSNNGGRIFDGNISEVLVYNDLLSDADKEKINSYLALKYGLTISHDYFSASGTMLKNVGDGYGQDIAGIGRDDCGSLNQRQSKSIETDAILTVGLDSITTTNQNHGSSFNSDEQMLIWGNDGTAVNVTWNNANVSITGGDYSIIDRKWYLEETFDVQNTVFRIDVDDPDFDLPAMPGSANGSYYVLFDDDGDFTNGGSTTYAMSLVSGSEWEVLVTDPEDGYFTFGINYTSPEEICGNLNDDNNDGRTDEPYPGGVQLDMQLWLKAETGTNTTINGNDVTSWTDQSINDYSADADVNSTDDPIYLTNALNFNPGIEFDGTYTDDFSDGLHLGTDYIYSTNEGVHVFVVVNPTAGGTQYDRVYDFGGTFSDGYGVSWFTGAARFVTPASHGGTGVYYGHNTGLEPSLIEFEIDFNDSQSLYKDGSLLRTEPITLAQLTSTEIAESDHYGTSTNGDDTSGPVSIGRKSASQYLDQDRIFNGSISEVIVYNDSLSQTETEKVNSYLAIKYGITLNHDYFSSSGSMKKNVSDGYANAIGGIGRDDCSGLNQKQSKSAEPEAIVSVGLGNIDTTNQANGATFSGDGTYLIWGNDGTAINATWNNANVSITGGDYSRIDRRWYLEETFDVQNTIFRVDVDDSDFDLPAMPGSANGSYYLLIDDDGDFTNGGTTPYEMSLVSGSEWEVLVADPGDSYFSFGINTPLAEICNNGIDDDGDNLVDCEDADCLDCTSICGDNDGDNIGDFCDLDDDNDGIPDVDEINCPGAAIALGSSFTSSTATTGTIPNLWAFDNINAEFDFALIGSNPGVIPGWSSGVSIQNNGLIQPDGQYLNLQPIITDIDAGDYAQYTIDFSALVYALEFKIGGMDNDDAVEINSYANGVAVPVTIADINLGANGVLSSNRAESTASSASAPNNSILVNFSELVDSIVIRSGKTSGSVHVNNVNTIQLYELSYCSSFDFDSDGVLNSMDLDSDNDGIYDVDEAGHNAADANDDGVIDGASSTFGTNGLFNSLEAVVDNGVLNYTISDSEATPDGTYDAYEIDADGDGCNDTEEENISDVDNDGIAGTGTPTVNPANGLVTSITYAAPTVNIWQNPIIGPCLTEICTDNIDNDNDGDTDCLDSDCANITLSNIVVSTCIDQPLRDVATVSVDVAWTNAPANDTIEISIGDKTDYVFVAAGATSPQTMEFLTIADGSTDIDITSTWRNSIAFCPDTISFDAPVACSNDTIACNILYLCGDTKPGDGDAWDHGIMDYLDSVNGTSDVSGVLAKPDVSGIGTYDPDNPTTPVAVNLGDYDMIFVSCSTEGQLASDLIDSLKYFQGSILNNNYLVSDDLGMSNITGGFNFGTAAYVDDIVQVEINNYDNVDNSFAYLFTWGNYLAGADSYLWMNTFNQSSGINGIIFHYTEADALSGGITDHGSRTYLGYHMNGIYINTENGGSMPVPSSAYFSPEKHLTLTGKDYFDQAIILAATSCNEEICNDNIDNDGDELVDCNDPDCISSGGIALDLTDSTDCISNSILTLSGASPSGGAYSGTGVSGTNFDAAAAGEGTHVITYTITQGNGCIITATDSIVVYNLTSVNFNLADTLECVTSTTLELRDGTPGGGTFSGLGVTGNNFDASVAGVGTHAVTYTITDGNGCVGTGVDSVTVLPLPSVSLTLTDNEECVNNASLVLDGGLPVGGTYSGTGVSGGSFNASVAGLGTHTISYTFTDTEGCINTATDDITVVALPSVSLSLTNDSDCVSDNSLALAGGSPSGGTYSGTGVTLTNFDATIAGAGVHEITYSYTDPGTGCVNTATDNIVVFALPSVSFVLSDDEECILNNTFALDDGLPVGGTYSGTGVSGTNFDATVAGLGTHTITYTYTDGNGCINTATDDIEVVNATSVSLTLATDEACAASNTLALSGGSPSGGTYSGAGVSGTNFNPGAAGAGTHNVFYTYTDPNGCSNTAIDQVTVFAPPSFTTVTPSNPTTCGGGNGSITIIASGGTGSYEYRLNSGAWQTGNVFNGLSAGNYDVFIRNDNGFCEVAFAGNSITLSDPSNPTAQINLPSSGCVDASSNISAANAGVGATYSWNFGSGASPATATGIGPHAVTFSSGGSKNISLSVTLAGCTAGDNESFTVNNLPAVSLTFSNTSVCVTNSVYALNEGTPSGGTYSGTGVSGTNFDASSVGVGTHTVIYTYTDPTTGCTNSTSDDIEVLALPNVTLTLGTDEACISSTTLTLNGANLSGGTFSGPGVSGTNFDASSVGAGTHTITYTYTDGNGCANTATDDIEVYDFPTINLVNHSDPTTCGGTEGSISITASGATGSFEYRLNTGSWQSSNVFSGLAAGSYAVSVRNSNDFCEISYVSNPVVLDDPPATIVTTNVISNYTGEDISCVGEADGFATASGSGGTGPYSYVWSDGQTGDTLRNVLAGTYTVTATDALGCQGTQTVTLNDPPPLGVNATFTDVSCYGGFDGAIDVTAIGGVGAYTYSWNDLEPEAFWAFDGSMNDISGNNHNPTYGVGFEIYSTDAVDGGQSFYFDGGSAIWYDDDVSFLESPFTERTLIMWIKPDDLNGRQMLWDEGGRTHGLGLRLNGDKLQGAARRGGDAASAYEMTFPSDGNWHQVGFVFDNGDFTLMIDGVMGATFDTGFPNIPMLGGGANQCGVGAKLGEDSFGGFFFSNPRFYQGLMDNVSFHDIALRTGQVADNFTDDGDRTGLPAGDYEVFVYDLNGCVDSITLTLNQPDSLALTANITDVLCNGDNTGEIDLVISGGVGPFSQSWSTGASTENISNLTEGKYIVTVTDDNDCVTIDSFTINEPPELTGSASVTSNYNTYDVTCFGATDGNGTATPVGGVAPYRYLWSNGQTTADLSNVGAGTYGVTITDDNDCTVTASVSLSNPPQIAVSASVTSSFGGEDISCVGADDGVASATATNGVGTAYNYTWSNGQTGAILNNVVAGTYTVTASDANGCSSTASVTLSNPPAISLSTSITSNYNGAHISCAGETDGSADASATGGIGVFTYAWSNGQSGLNLLNVGAGVYTVTATDAFGCTATETITLVNPDNVDVDIDITSDYNGESISCNDGTDGTAIADGEGGVGPYTYGWSNGQTGASLTNVGAGTYTVTVTDANGCTSTESIEFDEPSELMFSVASADPSDCGENDGIILFTASGGIGTYEYSIDGANWQSSNSFTSLAPGTYFTYVRSTLGACQIGPTAVVVNIPEAPTIDNITIINPTTGSSNDGGILVAASGNGTGIAIEYSINGSTWQSSNLFSGLSEGSYTLEVRFVSFTCESSSPFTLVAGGGVIGQSGGENYCSDNLSGVQFVETYYIPYPEDQVFTSLSILHSDTCGTSVLVEEPIQTYVSLGAVEAGTVIYYDHWEDGYEPNLSFPIQSTTEIWGDGNPSNGIPPGYSVDYLAAADIIVLNNSIESTTRQTVIDFDAGDKLGSLGNLSMTRLAWASGINTLLAGALEVYPVLDWGTDFQIPVGVNADVNFMFEYTAVTIMASQNNTTVNIDTDANGSNDVSISLDEGESYLVNGAVAAGATINASSPVQVDLITGDICARAEARFFTIKPTDQWSDSYYNPVATENTGAAGTEDDNHPTYVHLYNPNSGNIQVRWETDAGYQGEVAVAGNSTNTIEVPDSTGSRFYTNNGREFYAIATIDSDGDGSESNSAHDWGFALVPEGQVSNQITLVGFAPGQDPTACTSASIDKSGWSLEFVDSEETISESAPATNAFDGDVDTYWYTEYNGTPDDPQPHEIQIDLGANYDISGFRYHPRVDSKITNTLTNNTYVGIDDLVANTITSQINVPIGGFISDVNVLNLDVTHSWVSDLLITLTSPSGTEVTLVNRTCGDNDDIDIDIDDSGAAYGSWPCPPLDGNAYQPFGSLSDFSGEDAAGVWTLEIQDFFDGDGGGLNGWQLQVTTGTVGNGTIEDYEFYVSLDGSNWSTAIAAGAWANNTSIKEESFSSTNARYVRLVSTSEVNGNPWTSVAELDILECVPTSNENSAPVWLTAAYPTGSSSTGAITVCVDYNGNGGSLADVNGQTYDASVVLNNLENAKIYDPDGDQTGMQIWVCDGSDAIIAGAWGQDPATASGGTPAIDLGVGLPNGIPFATSKCVDLTKDFNSNGLYDECDEIIYTLFIRNSGALPLSTGSINVRDTLPSDINYLPNSTVAIINGVVNNVSDDANPSSPFPLDEIGINYSAVIQPGDSVIFQFEGVIGDISGAKFITNTAHVSNAQRDLYPEVSFPAQEPTGAILTGVPMDTTLMCGAIPAEPTIGSDIYVTNNCEELDLIPQAGWTVDYVDSQQASEPATNAFDGNNNTFWHTEYSPSNPGHNHEIQIDLGATYNVAGFRYLPRQSGDNGKIADFEFFVSEDGVSWGTAVTDGTWSNSTAEEEEVFSITRARYIRLVAESEINGNPWTSIAELNVLQCVNFAPVSIDFTETSTKTNNGSSTDDCYEITRNWEATDHCGEVSSFSQTITVIDTIAPIIFGIPADITVASNSIPEAPGLDCSTLSNVALGKPTSQSSVDYSGQSSRAVDGNSDGVYNNNSVTHTLSEVQPWWEVDLQAVYPIDEIEIWNRTDCCSARLTNYYVFVSDQAFASDDLSTNLLDPEITAYFQSVTAGSPSIIEIDTTARYVRIQLQGTEVLSLAEVVVTPSCINATDGCDPDVELTYSEVNIPAGCSYDILRTWEATDNCGNVSSQTQTITVSSTMNISTAVTSEVSCNGATDGQATATVSGGVAPVTINWSNSQSGTLATGLGAGTYYITATDGVGCITEDSITLIAPPNITINANVTSDHNGEDISCFGGNDGSVFANASGGTGTITYEWSSGDNTAGASGLTAGTYTVTATDANDCTVTTTVTLNNPDELTVDASVTSDFNGEDISCPGLGDGEATAVATGGTGTITYNWNNSTSGAVNPDLFEGTYYVTATDINGCFAIDSVTLDDPTIITFTFSTETDPSICEGTDGVVEISASGGMGTYQYRIGTTGTWQSGNTFSGLAAGTYDFYARNSDGTCVVGPNSVTLDDPIPQSCPIVTVADTLTYCNTDVSVSLSIVATSGASGYTWTVPVGMNIVSGAGTNALELDMNEISTGSYDICVVTNSNCGDSPSCCITFEIIECEEICNNGIDDDGDGDIDLEDDDCLTCDVVYSSDEEFLQRINLTSGLAEDSLNASALINDGDAIGLDPISLRFYFLEAGSTNPSISYLDPNTGNQVNTGVNIPAIAIVPSLGFNSLGLGYAIAENGNLYSITTNAGGSDIPAVTLLGNIGAATLGDLAVDNDGMIWAVLNSNELYKIDPTIASPTSTLIGTLTEISNFGGNDIESVAFAPTGQLLVGAGSSVYNVNIATGQGTLLGSLGRPTHDFASCAFPVFSSDLTVSKTVAQTGTVAPGDTLDYTISVSNIGTIVSTGTTLTDTIPFGTSYVPGSTFLNGNAVADVAGEMPYVNGGLINSSGNGAGSLITGNDAVITFRVVIDCCPGVATISNQGSVDYDGASGAVLSDDPSLPGTTDPTDIDVSILAAPVFTMAATNQTIDCNLASNGTALTNWLDSNGGATATVSCGVVTWTNNYTALSDLCGGTGSASVIFTATNDCGLSVNTTATFTIIDTIAPVWASNPADITIECNGTADPRGEVSAWLNANGGGTVSDLCGNVNVTHDFTVLPTSGCGNTGSVLVTFTATDECTLTSERTANLTILDSTAPDLTSVPDITVDCDDIPAPVAPTVSDSCDTSVDVVYNEVIVHHPNGSWKGTGSCSLIHTVSSASYDDNGTSGDVTDDEMTFTITVIGQNTSAGWSASVNGTPISGEYYKTYEFGPIISNGSVLNFNIVDDVTGACILPVSINAADF